MAAFHESELNYRERLDWALLQCGPIALFHKPHVLAAFALWLKQHGYVIAEADCGSCDSKTALLNTICQALGVPEGPNPNLDSFNDECRNIEVPEDGGSSLVLLRFDRVTKRLPEIAEQVLDILANASRDQLLFGRRFLCLVQSDNPQVHFGPVGGLVPCWNPQEWLDKDRGL
jgi:Barstar (barnase inhibitor)